MSPGGNKRKGEKQHKPKPQVKLGFLKGWFIQVDGLIMGKQGGVFVGVKSHTQICLSTPTPMPPTMLFIKHLNYTWQAMYLVNFNIQLHIIT
jgi:hypothetical protein